jgi:4-carboxymuconolactone decarboxylase
MAELPFHPSKLSDADRALYHHMVERRKAEGAAFGGPYAALMNHPQLCSKIEDLGFYLKYQGHLPRNIYQFVVLCVARSAGAPFEWVDHIKHAEAAEVPFPVIDAVKKNGLSGGPFGAPYDLVAGLLAATLSWKNIPQDIQNDCIQRWGIEGLVELVVLSGFYQMFSAINEGFNVPLPPGVSQPF